MILKLPMSAGPPPGIELFLTRESVPLSLPRPLWIHDHPVACQPHPLSACILARNLAFTGISHSPQRNQTQFYSGYFH